MSLVNTLRFNILAFEGRESVPALHNNVFTLFGTRRLQMPYQILLVGVRSEGDGAPLNSSSIRSLYANLIEYLPSGECD